MFLCKDCTIQSMDWMFSLEMAPSYGCCEVCEEVKPCIDLQSDCIDQEKLRKRRKEEEELESLN